MFRFLKVQAPIFFEISVIVYQSVIFKALNPYQLRYVNVKTCTGVSLFLAEKCVIY